MLPQLPADKANHLLYGALAFNLAYPLTDALTGLAIVAALGVAKEVSDWALNRRAEAQGRPAPHGVEAFDCIATFAGGLLCFLPLTHF